MQKEFSIYLDLLRFMMAGLVFLAHINGFTDGFLWQLSHLGHLAVVFFFVLSGLVIGFVVLEKQESAKQYVLNRSLRIYTVALPALLLTVVLFWAGNHLQPELFERLLLQMKSTWLTLLLSISFLNQSWSATPVFSNLPYWSLGYEVLFYVFFGLLIYTKGAIKYLLVMGILVVMGPSILLYLPIWLLGVGCFYCIQGEIVIFRHARFWVLVSITGIVLMSYQPLIDMLNQWIQQQLPAIFYQWLLEPAQRFFGDYILALFIVLHLLVMHQVLGNVRLFSVTIVNYIRLLAGVSFALYLFHMPMLYFFAALFPPQQMPWLNLITCLVVTPVIILGIGLMLERWRLTLKARWLAN